MAPHPDQMGQHWRQDSTENYTPHYSENPVTSNSHQTLPAAWTNHCVPGFPAPFPAGADPTKLYGLPLRFSGYEYAHCPDYLGESYDTSPGINSGYLLPLQMSGDNSETQSTPKSLLTTWGSPHGNHPSSMTYSSTESNGFSPAGYTPFHYLGDLPAYDNSAVVSPKDDAVKQDYPQKVSEGHGQASTDLPQPATSSERHITPACTATFDAKTMNEVTAKQTAKIQKRKSGKLIHENRNATCEKHKKQKKECNPDKCPGNKKFQRHQKEEEQARVTQELLRGSASRSSHYGYDLETASLRYEEAASDSDKIVGGDSAADRNPASYDEPTTVVTEDNVPTNTSTALFLRDKGKGKEIAQFSDLSETVLDGNAYGMLEPTKEDMRLWKKHPNVNHSRIPRMVSGGISSKELIFSGEEEETQMEDYVQDGKAEFKDGETLQRTVDKEFEKEDQDNGDNGDSDDDGNGGDPDDRSWDRYQEYGDYFKGHDKDWEEDGKGPDESSGNNGGGYPRPQGGYYAFSSGCERLERSDKLDGILSRLTIC